MSRRKRIFRIILHISLILVWLLVVYLGMGAPSFTAEMAMRRHEAAQWVGPSKIIAQGETQRDNRRMLLGETEYGYVFYEHQLGFTKWDNGILNYIPKDDPRICYVMNRFYYGAQTTVLPVYSICAISGAASARLTLISDVTVETPVTLTHTADSQLQDGVYFLFEVEMTDLDTLVPQAWNLWLMGESWHSKYVQGTMRLEYFDREGNLIATQEATYPAE